MILYLSNKAKPEKKPMFIVVRNEAFGVYLTDLTSIFWCPLAEARYSEVEDGVEISCDYASVRVEHKDAAKLIKCLQGAVPVRYQCLFQGKRVALALSADEMCLRDGENVVWEQPVAEISGVSCDQSCTVRVESQTPLELKFDIQWESEHIHTLLDFAARLSRGGGPGHQIQADAQTEQQEAVQRQDQCQAKQQSVSCASDASHMEQQHVASPSSFTPKLANLSTLFDAPTSVPECFSASRPLQSAHSYNETEYEETGCNAFQSLVLAIQYLDEQFTFALANGEKVFVHFAFEEALAAHINYGLITEIVRLQRLEMRSVRGSNCIFAFYPSARLFHGPKKLLIGLAQAINTINANTNLDRTRQLFRHGNTIQRQLCPDHVKQQAMMMLMQPVTLRDSKFNQITIRFVFDDAKMQLQVIERADMQTFPFIALQTLAVNNANASFIIVPFARELVADSIWFEAMKSAISLVVTRDKRSGENPLRMSSM